MYSQSLLWTCSTSSVIIERKTSLLALWQQVSWGLFQCCRSSKRQRASRIQMSNLWVAHCKLYRDSVSVTSGKAFFYFHVLIYDWNLWITKSEPKPALGSGLDYKPFLSAVDRLRRLWQDLCRLRRGTSPFCCQNTSKHLSQNQLPYHL